MEIILETDHEKANKNKVLALLYMFDFMQQSVLEYLGDDACRDCLNDFIKVLALDAAYALDGPGDKGDEAVVCVARYDDETEVLTMNAGGASLSEMIEDVHKRWVESNEVEISKDSTVLPAPKNIQ